MGVFQRGVSKEVNDCKSLCVSDRLWLQEPSAYPTEDDHNNARTDDDERPPFEDIQDEVEHAAPALFEGANETTAKSEVGGHDRNDLVIADVKCAERNLVVEVLKFPFHRLDVAPNLLQLALDFQHFSDLRSVA